MTALPVRTASFAFGAANQAKGIKHLDIGELSEAINIRMEKEGVYQNRVAFSFESSVSFPGAFTQAAAVPLTGVLQYAPESALAGPSGALLVRDIDDRSYVWDPVTSRYIDRGRAQRAYARFPSVINAATAIPRPVAIAVGANTWTFSSGAESAAIPLQASSYSFVVTNTTTGLEVYRTREIGTTYFHTALTAVYDGTYVWVLYADYNGTVTINVIAHRYDPASPSTAPVVTTYDAPPASGKVTQLKAKRLTAAGKTLVVYTTFAAASATGAQTVHSYLDPAAGTPLTLPVEVAATTVAQPYINTGLSILAGDTASAFWYALWRPTGGGAATASLVLVECNATTTAIVSTTTLGTEAVAVGAYGVGVTCGYRDSVTGNRIVFAQLDASTNMRQDLYKIVRATYDGAATTLFEYADFAWIASDPVLYGSTWYMLTGYDDRAVAPLTENGLQRTLFLCDSNGKIITPIAYAQGPGTYHYGDPKDGVTLAGRGQCLPHVPPLLVADTHLIAPIGINPDTGLLSVALLDIAMSETYGRPVQVVGGLAVAPGGMPVAWGKATDLHECGPMLFPSYIYRRTGAAAGATGIACVYKITEADGTVWRSAPVIAVQACGPGDVLSFPILQHRMIGSSYLNATHIEAEIYAGTTDLQLQGIVDLYDQLTAYGTSFAPITTGYADFTLPATLRTGETLYTTGGALSNSPTPAGRCIAAFGNRVFIANGSTVWCSQEMAPGFAPQFNEALNFQWNVGSGDILAMEPIDGNYLAIFKIDAVAVISGPGPDGHALGNYIPQTLSSEAGGTQYPKSVKAGPAGCYYQSSSNTGRIRVITPALQMMEAAGGVYDLAGTEIIDAVYAENYGAMWFLLSDEGGVNTIINLDCAHKTETAPLGRVSAWKGAGIDGSTTGYRLRALAYSVTGVAGGPVAITEWGFVRYTDSTSGVDSLYNSTHVIPLPSLTCVLQPANLMGQFEASAVQLLGTYRSTCTVRLTTYPDYSASGTAVTLALTAEPAQVRTRPPNCGRIQSLRVRVDLTVSSGMGIDFEGFALEYKPYGRVKGLNTTRVI